MEAPQRFFGTDGIRDQAGKGFLSPENILRIGRGIAALFFKGILPSRHPGRPTILLSMDTRASGPGILEKLSESLLASGTDLFDAGILPTPALAFLTAKGGFDLGIMISASHNPAKDNGIKIFNGEGVKLGEGEEMAIEEAIAHPQEEGEKPGRKAGRLTKEGKGLERYVETCIQRRFSHLSLKGVRIVADCAHGSTFQSAPAVFARLGAQIKAINTKPNGSNINDGCGALHPEIVRKDVLKEKAHMGLSFDGDGDRVIFVDEEGNVRDGDHVLGALGASLSKKGLLKANTIVTTSMSNVGLEIFLRGKGIRLLRTEVGDRFVYTEMERNGYSLGGEPSGHILFSEVRPMTGDGLITALMVLELLSEEGLTLSESCRAIQKAPQYLLNVPVTSKPPFAEIEEIRETLRKTERSLEGKGRIVLRYSGTEPLARVMVEGMEEGLVRRKAEEMAEVIRKHLH